MLAYHCWNPEPAKLMTPKTIPQYKTVFFTLRNSLWKYFSKRDFNPVEESLDNPGMDGMAMNDEVIASL